MIDDDEDFDPDAVIPLRLGDELDLHAFAPRDVPDLVRGWLEDCVEAGYLQVRIVHGKGIGALRETVHAVLRGHPAVEAFGQDGGNWGATVVRLRRLPPSQAPEGGATER